MNLLKELTRFKLTADQLEAGLKMLELTPQDFEQLEKPQNRFTQLLKAYNSFPAGPNHPPLEFFYTGPNSPILEKFRSHYALAQIAGTGSDIEQALNLMHWTHQLTEHTSNAQHLKNINTLTLLNLIETKNIKINCALFAAILKDACLAVGLKARVIHLKPHPITFNESHLVNAVYSSQRSKWIYLDPNLNAYFIDQDRNALSIAEVRQCLADSSPLYVNHELTFNTDNLVFRALGTHFSKQFYKLYIAKNIFRIECPQQNAFNTQPKTSPSTYFQLIPAKYHPELLSAPQTTGNKTTIYTTHAWHFWQKPTAENKD